MQNFVYFIAFRPQVKVCRLGKAQIVIPCLCNSRGNRSVARKAVLNLHYQKLARVKKPNYSELELSITFFPLFLKTQTAPSGIRTSSPSMRAAADQRLDRGWPTCGIPGMCGPRSLEYFQQYNWHTHNKSTEHNMATLLAEKMFTS